MSSDEQKGSLMIPRIRLEGWDRGWLLRGRMVFVEEHIPYRLWVCEMISSRGERDLNEQSDRWSRERDSLQMLMRVKGTTRIGVDL